VYRFLLKPGWILSHIFVLACVVAFVNLGIWQLRRLDERTTYNAEVAAAEALPPELVATLLPDGAASTAEQVDAVVYRTVQVTGTYALDQQVLVQNRTNGGAPGFWVLTPLVQADGTAVVINRGWVPINYTVEGPWTDFDPPTGTVSVLGMLQVPQVRPTSGLITGPSDAADGVLRSLARVDVPRLQQQVDEQLLPIYVNHQAQEPAQVGPIPEPLPKPELSEGPHLNYAGQWFIFALLTCIVYPLLLRRVARRRLTDDPGADSDVVELADPPTAPGPGPDGGDAGPPPVTVPPSS
jgi:cytochrome oxidase assembly protein ShyY1